jgi:predicted DsbA family dithiol-disulfide isomerase
MMKHKIKIDVVSDVVCPWCYIGKRRLEKAIDMLKNEFEFDITYHPFELNPQVPPEGIDQKAFLINKFGSVDQYEALTNRVTVVAAQEGLILNYEKQEVMPNTRKAHALIDLAQTHGLQIQVVEALFDSYFAKGVDLSREENLVQIGENIGLAADDIREKLNGADSLRSIQAKEEQLSKLGISGVPFYIINEKYAVSGAQQAEMFVKAFKEISNYPLLMGEVCDADGKRC